MNYCIAGIHTGIGKTVCSAILCQSLGFDYWKPVQAGDLENSDSLFIAQHVTHPGCMIHRERFRLSVPASPHYAAEIDHIKISREDFKLPATKNNILVETAGGVMSPLAADLLNIDLIEHLNMPVILVSNNYLGSINHTLLSFHALKARNIRIAGLVFDGESVPSTEKFILEYTGLPLLFSIPIFQTLNAESIRDFTLNLGLKL